jgi:uncharacterized protein YdaU (DUF1376 family)
MMYERGEAIQRDDKRLSRLCGCTKSSFTKALDALIAERKITHVDGALSQERVEKERKKRQEKSQKASLSAQERWKAHGEKNKQKQQADDANALQTSCETDAIPDTRSQKPESKKEIKIDFGIFWRLWPNKVSKPAAKKAWDKLPKEDQEIIVSLRDAGFANWRESAPDANPIHATTFLNQRRWEDVPFLNGGQHNGNGTNNLTSNRAAEKTERLRRIVTAAAEGTSTQDWATD